MQDVIESKLLWSTKQLANHLGLKRYQIEHLIDTGKIPDSTLRVSNRRLFTQADVEIIESMIEEHKREEK